METCQHCNQPVDRRKGYFYDHNSGVTMHSKCFLGVGPKRGQEPEQLPLQATADDRLAA